LARRSWSPNYSVLVYLNHWNPRVVAQELVIVLERAPPDYSGWILSLHQNKQLVPKVNLGLFAVIIDLLPEAYKKCVIVSPVIEEISKCI
jgi:hypothetical protein